MIRRALLLPLLLMACARSEDPSVVGDGNETSAVEQVRTPEQDDEEIAIGEWRDTLQEQFAALEFGPNGAPPLFSLRCDERRAIFLQRHGAALAGDLPTMLVSIGSETRRLAVTSAGGAVPMLRASLAPSDTLIATLGEAAVPMVVRIGDAPPLVLPPSPTIASFLERCQRGSAAETGRNEAAEGAIKGNEAVPVEPAPETR